MKIQILLLVAFISFFLQEINCQWSQVSSTGRTIYKFSSFQEKIYAGTYEVLYVSTDNSNSWDYRFYDIGTRILPLAVTDSIILVGSKTGIYKSTDNCQTWGVVNNGLTDYEIASLTKNNLSIFAGTRHGNVFRSSNLGTNWDQVIEDIGYYSILHMTSNGSNIYLLQVSSGNSGDVVQKSTDNGLTWIAIYSAPAAASSFPTALESYGAFVYLGIGNHYLYGNCIFISSDYGVNWTHTDSTSGLPSDTYVNGFIASDTIVIAGTTNKGIFLSTNNGTNWEAINDGLLNTSITALTVNNNFIFAATDGASVYRKPLSEVGITSVHKRNDFEPNGYFLVQNYPNPFNPFTKIRFEVPSFEFVTIKIFDVLGREITTLINEEKSAGIYEIEFDGSHLSSGVYFYQLSSGSFIVTKKMVLLK